MVRGGWKLRRGLLVAGRGCLRGSTGGLIGKGQLVNDLLHARGSGDDIFRERSGGVVLDMTGEGDGAVHGCRADLLVGKLRVSGERLEHI